MGNSNIDNPMDRLNGLTQRINQKLHALGLSVEHVAFTPSSGTGGQHMVQLVLRLEPSALMESGQESDVALSDDEKAAFEAIMGGADKVDSSEVDREAQVEEVEGWLNEDL